MLKTRLHIVSVLAALLWVVSGNHCAWESLLSSPENSTQSDCQSHSKTDPNSHSEGQPCGTKLVVWSSTEILALKPEFVESSNLFWALLSLPQHFPTITNISDRTVIPIKPDPLLSLSIASNAPPLRSA